MSKENKTEKIINEKLNSREFAFDEKAWAGMETLLDAQEKKRRFGFFWYFSASMFVALVAGATFYVSQKSDDTKQVIAIETTKNTETTNLNIAKEQNGAKTSIIEQKEVVFDKKSIQTEQKSTKKTVSKAKKRVSSVTDATSAGVDASSSAIAAVQSEVDEAPAVLDASASVIDATQSITNTTAVTVEKPSSTTADSASLAETAKNPLTAPGKETKNAWGVMAGVGYWFPYQTTLDASTNEGRFGFTGGIYYTRILHKRWELGLSAIYSSRGALDFDKTFVNTNYGFGIESDKTTVSPKTLHYLNIPFAIRFNATPRSHFYIGAAYYQLLATTSEVTRTIEDSFTSSVVSSEKQTGEHKGFRKNDVAAFIGYELTLFERMNLGLQVSYGFYDITNDSYQKHDDIILKGFDRNISLQLQLKYDLIRH
jgi:hypothetical protein